MRIPPKASVDYLDYGDDKVKDPRSFLYRRAAPRERERADPTGRG
jgi:hypothetical protein